MLMVGVARANIDPPLSVPHAGWGAQTHIYADGIDGGLFATALVASDGQRTGVLLEYDLCMLTNEQAEEVRQQVAGTLGTPVTAVRVCTTHNHAGAMWGENYYGVGEDARAAYHRELVHQGVGAALLASRSMVPARVAGGRGRCEFAGNRRQKLPGGRVVTGFDPEGACDPDVLVARIDREDGAPLACIFSYTAHPTVLGPANRLVSADYPGAAKRVIETLTGAVPLFLQGATGNVGPGPEGFTGDVRVAHRLGRILGCEAVQVYEGIRGQPVRFVFDRVVESGAPLGYFRAEPLPVPEQGVDYRSVPLRLPVLPQPSVEQAEAEAKRTGEHLAELKAAQSGDEAIAAATFVAKRAGMALRRTQEFGGAPFKELELHVLRLGPVVMAAIPAEPFVETGAAIKAGSPFPWTQFGGYTNGWSGYVPTAASYADGGYEVDTTPFAKGAAESVAEATIAVLREMAGRAEGSVPERGC